jgi:hypothetical protein
VINIMLKVMLGGICFLLIFCNCATIGGGIIGAIADYKTADSKKIDLENIIILPRGTPIEVQLVDNRKLTGKILGFAGNNSDSEEIGGILPYFDEKVDLYYLSGNHFLGYFKSLSFKPDDRGITPILSLGTTGQELTVELMEFQKIIRTNGDTLKPGQIRNLLNQSKSMTGVELLLTHSDLTSGAPVEEIRGIKQFRNKVYFKIGFLSGIIIDTIFWVYMTQNFHPE